MIRRRGSMLASVCLLVVVCSPVAAAGSGTESGTGRAAPAPFATFRWSWGHHGSGLAQYRNPTDIAAYTNPIGVVNVVVSDAGNARFTVMTDRGAFLEKWGEPGSGPRQFNAPWGLTLAPNGDVLIADGGNGRIQRVTSWTDGLNQPAGRFLGAVGKRGSAAGELDSPSDVAIDAAGALYVVDRGNHRIQKLSAAGEPLLSWGGAGSEPGQFLEPLAIALGGDGSVYVTDYRNERVQQFDSAGRFSRHWGAAGTGPGEFAGPAGIAVDTAGRAYVVDRGNHRVQVFDAAGGYLGAIGSEGTGKGQLLRPSGVAVDGVGKVYVVDTGNHRVQVFMRP